MSKLGRQTVSFPSGDMEKRAREAMAAARRRAFLESGGIKRAGIHDAGCPCCGVRRDHPFVSVRADGSIELLPWVPQKRHCLGRDPGGEEKDPGCYILGGHIHAQCPACTFAWFERMGNDLGEDERYGLLAPGVVVVPEGHEYDPPSLGELYGWAGE